MPTLHHCAGRDTYGPCHQRIQGRGPGPHYCPQHRPAGAKPSRQGEPRMSATIRLPITLHAEATRYAADSGRSVNAMLSRLVEVGAERWRAGYQESNKI